MSFSSHALINKFDLQNENKIPKILPWFMKKDHLFDLENLSDLPHDTSDADVLEHFKISILELHDSGAYSKAPIYHGTWNCLDVAIKAVRISEGRITRHIKNEIEVVKCITHPHIVAHYCYFNAAGRVYSVMEFLPHGTLGSYMRQNPSLPMNLIKKIFKDILSAISYLHSLFIAHRDIKDENIVLRIDDFNPFPVAKLCDFGFSIKLNNTKERCKNFCGTRSFKSPELIKEIPYSPFKSDMWAMGVLLYKMINRVVPVYCPKKNKLQMNVTGLMKPTMDLLENLLKIEPEHRMDSFQASEHKFFKEESKRSSKKSKHKKMIKEKDENIFNE